MYTNWCSICSALATPSKPHQNDLEMEIAQVRLIAVENLHLVGWDSGSAESKRSFLLLPSLSNDDDLCIVLLNLQCCSSCYTEVSPSASLLCVSSSHHPSLVEHP